MKLCLCVDTSGFEEICRDQVVVLERHDQVTVERYDWMAERHGQVVVERHGQVVGESHGQTTSIPVFGLNNLEMKTSIPVFWAD